MTLDEWSNVRPPNRARVDELKQRLKESVRRGEQQLAEGRYKTLDEIVAEGQL